MDRRSKPEWYTDTDGNIRLYEGGNQDYKHLGVQQSNTYVAVKVDDTMILVQMDLGLK